MLHLLSIGSNTPDAPALMARANDWLTASFRVTQSSGIYSSKATNGHSPDYLNMLAEIDSDLTVTELTAKAKDFERLCGRTPQSKARGEIEMDIDLIKSGNVILRPVEYTRQYFLTGLQLMKQHEI